jgi:alpha-D-ribose 1-methylphosphonate 5-triphosphate synthase subunit PhnH
MQVSDVIQTDYQSAEISSLDFRHIMNAMAYPGRPFQCPMMEFETSLTPMKKSAQQIANALVSREVNLSFFGQRPSVAALEWIRFTLRSKVVDIAESHFLFVDAQDLVNLNLEVLPLGGAESPENSITLLVSVDGGFQKPAQRPVTFSGPGVNPEGPPVKVNLDCVPTSFFEQRKSLAPLFPLGLDAYFCGDDEFIALPRTTQTTW